MSNRTFNALAQFQQSAFAGLRELGEIQLDVVERLYEQQKAAVNTYLDATSVQVEMLRNMDDYRDFLACQAEFARNQTDKLLAYAEETAEILEETRERLTDWIGKGIDEAGKLEIPALKQVA